MVREEMRSTNGHSAPAAMPTITLSSGMKVGLRRQPADAMAKAQAAAQSELAESKPAIPTQRLETEPEVWREIPNEADPDYRAALLAWNAEVAALTSQKLLLLMERFALVFEIDQQKLAEVREAYAIIGVELPENDRSAYLGYVLAPTNEDQGRLFMEVYGRGLPTEAQVALHRRMFPGNLEGHTA